MKTVRRLTRSAVRLVERINDAWRLYSRLGFPWADAWRVAGIWQ